MSTCTVRQARLEDMESLLNFSALAYPGLRPHDMKEEWIWQYRKNPNLGENLPFWIAEKEDSIVGQIGTIPVELKIGHVTLRGVWGVDLIVLPSCRGEGIGRQLIENVVKDNNCYMAVDMSDATQRIYDRLGYIQVHPVPIYRKVIKLSSGLVLEYLTQLSKKSIWIEQLTLIIPKTWLSQVLALLINRSIALRKSLAPQIKKRSQVDVLRLQSFGPEINELWTKVQSQYGIIAKRDQKFLNWRFAESAHSGYEIFVALKKGEIRGYVVLRKGRFKQRNLGYIVDLLADRNDPETIESLVRHAIDFFGGDVEVVECAFTPKEYQNVLRRNGFIKMKESTPYSVCLSDSIRAKMESLKREWFITRGDSDWDLDPAYVWKKEVPTR